MTDDLKQSALEYHRHEPRGKIKVVATKPVAMESTVKAWSSKDVPVGGLVKMESDSVMTMNGKVMNTKMTMKLTGSGK